MIQLVHCAGVIYATLIILVGVNVYIMSSDIPKQKLNTTSMGFKSRLYAEYVLLLTLILVEWKELVAMTFFSFVLQLNLSLRFGLKLAPSLIGLLYRL